MKNIKMEKRLVGPGWWRGTFAVEVQGDPNAAAIKAGLNQEEKEKVVQSWRTIAVLEVEPNNSRCYVGFISGTYIGVLKYPLETLDGRFGMRVGPGDVKFFAFDPNLESEIRLRLTEVTKEDDPRYQNLPLY